MIEAADGITVNKPLGLFFRFVRAVVNEVEMVVMLVGSVLYHLVKLYLRDSLSELHRRVIDEFGVELLGGVAAVGGCDKPARISQTLNTRDRMLV